MNKPHVAQNMPDSRQPIQLGNYLHRAWDESEIEVHVSKSLAPWDFANRAAHFLAEWLRPMVASEHLAPDAIDYVLNELLENAVKYAAEGKIEVRAALQPAQLSLSLRHSVSAARSETFAAKAKALIERDPFELFTEIVENNGDQQVSTGAGLGLVTMINDYGASLGFVFQSLSQQHHQVTCQVHLQY